MMYDGKLYKPYSGYGWNRVSSYALMGGQEQISTLSPSESLTRPTLGQNLCSRTKGNGKAACDRA